MFHAPKNCSLFIYILVSLIAIVVNIFTITNHLPWIDEVMFTDTPANYVLYNSWSTRAWYSVDSVREPFSTYLPLYQWLLCVWIKVIGFSFLKVRLLEIILYFIEGCCILNLTKKMRNLSMGSFSSFVFSVCYWFFPILCLTYRMGRVDILGALMATLLITTVYTSIKEQRNRMFRICMLAFLTMLAGIQAAVWTLAIATFAMLITKSYKPFVKPLVYSFASYAMALLTTAVFMFHMGYLKAFIDSFLNYSATLYKLWGIARLYVLPILGRPVRAIANLPEQVGFLEKLFGYFQEMSIALLTSCVGFLILANIKRIKTESYKYPVVFFLFSLYATFFLNLAGRYSTYYEWMSIFPLIISFALLCERNYKVLNRIIAIPLILFLCYTCKDEIKSFTNHEYDNVTAFVQRQGFTSSAIIATPMVTFYELKPTVPQTYFYEVYPTGRIPEVDYIILPMSNHGYYGYDEMHNYFKSIANNPKYQIELKDSCESPLLYLYSVIRQSEVQ